MIVFDLDGTLADCEHRRHLIEPEKYPSLCEYSNYYIDSHNQPVIDLDGKASWRYKNTGKPFAHGWQSFYEACDQDNPIKHVMEICLNCLLSGRRVQIWTGRCESTREKTVSWIHKNLECHFFKFDDPHLKVKMRPIGDYTPDDVLKERWLDEALSEGKKVDFVFDDSEECCTMWRRRGIFVFNCCQHDKEF